MRYYIVLFLTLFSFSAHAQFSYFSNYQSFWKYWEKNEPGTAFTVLDEIAQHALDEGNDGRLLEALLYRLENIGLTPLRVTPGETVTNVHMMKITPQIRAILQSIQGERLFAYMRNQRGEILRRTTIANDANTDVRTWNAARFVKEITAAYEASLKDSALLKEINVSAYSYGIENPRSIHNSLYEMLMLRALAYYQSGESTLLQAADRFELEDSVAFADAAVFAAHRFTTLDTADLQYKAVVLLQDLLRFNEAKSKSAYLDIDLKRVAYMWQIGTMPDKEALYVKLLKHMIQQYADEDQVTQLSYYLANYYRDHGDNREAVAICEEARKNKPGSIGATNCGLLLDEIRKQSLDAQTESVNIPDEPFRALIKYRNVNKVYLRIVRLDADRRAEVRENSVHWERILPLPVVRAWEVDLPAGDDYLTHSAEVKIDALPVGYYALIGSVTPDFQLEKNHLFLQATRISNLSYIENIDKFYVLNRKTGAPVSGVIVNERWNDYGKPHFQTAVSDQDGLAVMKESKRGYYTDYRYEFIQGTDTLTLGEEANDGRRPYDYTGKPHDETFLFTDRAIYRPGQTVYFKGIVLRPADVNNKGKRHVETFVEQDIEFFDPNRTRIASKKVLPDEYGAFAGSFKIPEGKMSGRFKLEAEYTSIDISVEEYKRPGFYVVFDSLKGSYQLNETVRVQGKAWAYAGHHIAGAKVKYRVRRETSYPYWWLYRDRGTNARHITHGETTTGSDGSFNITFPALPDKFISPEDKPVFTYTIEADITDLNGETRSGSESVKIGYHTIALGVNLDSRVVDKQLQQVRITTTNLNGVFEAVDVTASLCALRHPGKLWRKRYWDKPDQYTLSREAYEKAFPHDVYSDEDNPATWAKGKVVFTKKWTSRENSQVQLYHKSLAPGWYELTINTTDKYGQQVLQKKVFEMIDLKARRLTYPAYSWSYEDGQPLQPGDTAHFLLGTSGSVYVAGDGQLNGVTDKTYVVTEQDRGDKLLQYVFVKDNRLFTINRRIHVPWSNKELKVTIQSFRSKLSPGAQEEWRIHVSGDKRVWGEMVGTMFDASLDVLKPHSWDIPDPYPYLANLRGWQSGENFITEEANEYPVRYARGWWNAVHHPDVLYPYIRSLRKESNAILSFGDSNGIQPVKVIDYVPSGWWVDKKVVSWSASSDAPRRSKKGIAENVAVERLAQFKVRKDFNELAFFQPRLIINPDGDGSLTFTMPESLTRWRFMGLVHTPDARFVYFEKSVVTQKMLMVQSNPPRFVRQGDQITFAARISNVADSALSGDAQLTLLDATTEQTLQTFSRHFDVQPGQSTAVDFLFNIPEAYSHPLIYRVVAKAGDCSDGEEHIVPVLANRMLVTESLPIPMRGDGSKHFSFAKLLQSDSAHTLKQHALTVEYTANPAWYAVQALPYLMEYRYESAEQIFNRYYASTLAGYIVRSTPAIQQVFEKWKTADTNALKGNLEKNEELKNVLLEQTPWLLDARSESAQKQHIAQLFNQQGLKSMQKSALEKLKEMQGEDGGIAWFSGLKKNPFITLNILTGIAHLQHIGALKDDATRTVADEIVKKGVAFVDQYMEDWYWELKRKKVDMDMRQIHALQAYYLYVHKVINKPVDSRLKAYPYCIQQAIAHWGKMDIYSQAMLAIAMDKKEIIAAIKKRASNSEEMGMYWKEVMAGVMWWESPIETQVMLIEAFDKVTHDTVSVAAMKTWLLKHKQLNNWGTSKATADASYAMLMGGSNWLAADPAVTVTLDKTVIQDKGEAGTGYFKKRFDTTAVKPDMGNVTVKVNDSKGQPSWGAVYWQYFEQLDKITSAATPLVVEKQLYVESTNSKGQVLTAIKDGDQLKVGDKVKSRIIMRVDRAMDYVHLKDMRAACFEPVAVLSQIGEQNGVWYYQSTKDVVTDFFFDHLNEGLYVFEYSMFVTNAGDFSNGITTAQCMYAPEFSAHSEGVRIQVR